jgi:ABC-type enterobactin transport system permease subunit
MAAGFAGGFAVVVGFGAVVTGAVVVGSVGSGAVRVEPSFVTVRLPPVAVEMAVGSSPSLEMAIAAPVPRTAMTRPRSAGTTHGAAAQPWRCSTPADVRLPDPGRCS